MSTHTILAIRSGTHPTMGDFENEHTITFGYRPGSPDTYDAARGGPGGWDPGYPAEVEFISIEPGAGDHGAFSDLAQRWLEEWAADWLDEHHDECVEIAEHAREPDPDYARDMATEYRRIRGEA